MTRPRFAPMIVAAQLLLVAAACMSASNAAAQVAATQAATQPEEAAIKPLKPPMYASREQLLVIAAYNGDMPAVRKLVEDGTVINEPFEIYGNNISGVWTRPLITLPAAAVGRGYPDLIFHTGNTALHEALSRGRLEMAAYLLDQGADINVTDAAGFPPIYIAVFDPKKLDFLIARGANVNAKDRYGVCALSNAVTFNDVESVKKLLKAGADVHARDDRGQTPLHFVFLCDATMAKLLLGAGARVDVKDENGLTPLMKVEWSVERIELDKAARLKGPPRPKGRFESYTYTRPGPPPEYEALELKLSKGEALVQRLNDQRSAATKEIASVLKAAQTRPTQ